jgi:hypothetical protein
MTKKTFTLFFRLVIRSLVSFVNFFSRFNILDFIAFERGCLS